MSPAPRHHTLISGTGRAGTTLLVRILTRLGLPTGFDPDSLAVDEIAAAGLEHKILDNPSCPYIVKNTSAARGRIAKVLASDEVVLDHVIVCMRELRDAAASRRAVHARRLERGLDPKGPGALWGTTDPGRQEPRLAKHFHHLIFHLTAHEVPLTFIHFPRFARDPAYLHRKLTPMFPAITEAGLASACEAEVTLASIHDYSAEAPTGSDSGEARRGRS